MARKKVTIAWIANHASRRVTLNKRRNGLLKKVAELSTLCAVPACAIVYEPHKVWPEVWPSESKAKEILCNFKALPEAVQSKKRVDQEGFLRQSILKIRDQIKRQQRENRVLEMDVLLNQCIAGRGLMDVGFEEAVLLKRLIEEKEKVVKDKLAEMWASQMKAEEELTAMTHSLMMVEWINPNPNPNPNPIPNRNPSPIRDEKQVLGFFGGEGGYLDDVITHQLQDPCINGYGGSSSAWNMEDPSFLYPYNFYGL